MDRHARLADPQLRLPVAVEPALRQAVEVELQPLQGPVALADAAHAQAPVHHADAAQRRVAGALVGRAQQVRQQGGRGGGIARRVTGVEPAEVEREAAVGLAPQQQVWPHEFDGGGRQDAAQQRPHRERHRRVGQLRQHLTRVVAQGDLREAQAQRRLPAQAAPGDGGTPDAQAPRRLLPVQLRLDQPGEHTQLQRPLREPPRQRRPAEPEQHRQRDQQGEQRVGPAVRGPMGTLMRGLTGLHPLPFPGAR